MAIKKLTNNIMSKICMILVIQGREISILSKVFLCVSEKHDNCHVSMFFKSFL